MCVRAKFWDRLILPKILVVFKSPTTKIDFVDFLQIQVVFWTTNYTTFSYLLMPISWAQDWFFDCGREISTFALKCYGRLCILAFNSGLLVFKLQLKPLRKMCSAIQKFKESLFWFPSSKYILHRYDLHCALESYVERSVRTARIIWIWTFFCLNIW